jgi:hypothetical protein
MLKQWLRTQIAQMINVKKEGDDSIAGPNPTVINNTEQHVVLFFKIHFLGKKR